MRMLSTSLKLLQNAQELTFSSRQTHWRLVSTNFFVVLVRFEFHISTHRNTYVSASQRSATDLERDVESSPQGPILTQKHSQGSGSRSNLVPPVLQRKSFKQRKEKCAGRMHEPTSKKQLDLAELQRQGAQHQLWEGYSGTECIVHNRRCWPGCIHGLAPVFVLLRPVGISATNLNVSNI